MIMDVSSVNMKKIIKEKIAYVKNWINNRPIKIF